MRKSHKYFRNLGLTFWIMNIQYFLEHIFILKISGKIYVDQDPDPEPEPDPDVFERRIRIRSKIVRIRNTAYSITGIWQVNLLKNELLQFLTFLQFILYMPNLSFGAIGVGAASLYGSGSIKNAAPATQHLLTGQLLGFFQYECTYFKCK
jgi:hypothetical protein